MGRQNDDDVVEVYRASIVTSLTELLGAVKDARRFAKQVSMYRTSDDDVLEALRRMTADKPDRLKLYWRSVMGCAQEAAERYYEKKLRNRTHEKKGGKHVK